MSKGRGFANSFAILLADSTSQSVRSPSLDDGKSSYEKGYDGGSLFAVGAGVGLIGLLLWGVLKDND